MSSSWEKTHSNETKKTSPSYDWCYLQILHRLYKLDLGLKFHASRLCQSNACVYCTETLKASLKCKLCNLQKYFLVMQKGPIYRSRVSPWLRNGHLPNGVRKTSIWAANWLVFFPMLLLTAPRTIIDSATRCSECCYSDRLQECVWHTSTKIRQWGSFFGNRASWMSVTTQHLHVHVPSPKSFTMHFSGTQPGATSLWQMRHSRRKLDRCCWQHWHRLVRDLFIGKTSSWHFVAGKTNHRKRRIMNKSSRSMKNSTCKIRADWNCRWYLSYDAEPAS